MPQVSTAELQALRNLLDTSLFKEIAASIMAQHQLAELKGCRNYSLQNKPHEATVAAARSEAFGEVMGVFQDFADQNIEDGTEEEEVTEQPPRGAQ